MPGKLLYWSYNNIFYSNEFTWIIQVVVTLGIIISMCFIIFSKVESFKQTKTVLSQTWILYILRGGIGSLQE